MQTRFNSAENINDSNWNIPSIKTKLYQNQKSRKSNNKKYNLNMSSSIKKNRFSNDVSFGRFDYIPLSTMREPKILSQTKIYLKQNISLELANLKSLWNISEINTNYQKDFINYISKLNPKQQADLIIQEKKNLELIIDIFEKFNLEYIARKENLRKINENIYDIEKISKDDINFKATLQNVVDNIKELRIHSVKSIKYFNRIKLIIKELSKNKKINLQHLCHKYNYNENYLLTINDDILFIKDTKISDYIEMNNFNDMDTFLINCSFYNNNTLDKKIIIPIEENLIKDINDCKFDIVQEKVASATRHFFKKDDFNNCSIFNKKIKQKKDNFFLNNVNHIRINPDKKYRILIEHDPENNKNNSSKQNGSFFNNINKEKNEILYKNKIYQYENEAEEKNNKILALSKENSELKEKLILLQKENQALLDNISKQTNNNSNFLVEFYNGKLSELITEIKNNNFKEKICNDILTSFNLKEKNIYSELEYLTGVYPKIITSKDEKDNNLYGICCFYNENYGIKDQPKKIIINLLYAIGIDWEEHIKKMICFIQEKCQYSEINIKLFYEKNENNKFIMNKTINTLIKNLNFKYSSVENILSKNQRLQHLYYKPKQIISAPVFSLNTIFIVSLSTIKKESENNSSNKNINITALKILFNQLDKSLYIVKNGINKKVNYEEIGDYLKMSKNKNYENFETENIIDNTIFGRCDDLLYKDVYNKNKDEKNITIPCEIFKINYEKNIENCFSVIINNFYYSRISSNNINIFKMNGKKMFLIPLKDFKTFLLIYEIKNNDDIEGNIYEFFNDYFIKYQNGNNSQNDQSDKNNNIYLPVFSFKQKLNTNFINDVIKEDFDIIDNKSKKKIYINSIDEVTKINLGMDGNFDDNFQFNFEENDENIIIRDDFYLGVFNADMLSELQLPMLQIVKIRKENWKKVEQ